MYNSRCTPLRAVIVPAPQQTFTKQGKDVRAIRSISNPSMLSQDEEHEEHVEESLSQQFDLDYLDRVYSKYSALAGQPEGFVPTEIIKQISNVIETISLDENVIFIAMKFSEMVIQINDSSLHFFTTCAERNPIKFSEARGFVVENRLMMHIMMAVRTFRAIASALEEGKLDFALEVIDNLALSHLVMQVDPDLFKKCVVRFIKCLLHFKFITEDLMPPCVFFGVNIINHIHKRMEVWRNRHANLLRQMVDGLTAPSRYYYRELKKWKTFVLNLHKTLSKPIQAFEKQTASERKFEQVSPTDVGVSEEHWKIIRLLKKGYKYRTKVLTETFF